MRRFLTIVCLLFLSVGMVQAQKVVSGTITNAGDGEPLAGVTVFEKGTTNGTFTDEDGKYSITVDEDATLVFRFVGMKTMELDAASAGSITMESDDLLLDEVVVTALGIPTEKKQLGYSVQSVGGDALTQSGETNIINGLAAKVAGVQVINSSGVPGGSSYIRIRGNNSLTGSNQPLIVVDGVPLDNSQLNSGNPDEGNNNLLYGVALANRGIDLNGEDIESVTVLKGPSAAALYGIQAANGALIVTTKRGKATPGKKVNITFSTQLSIDQVNQLPELQNMYAQGTGWFDPQPTYYGPETGWLTSWGPRIDTLFWDGATNYDYDNNGQIVGQSDPTAQTQVSPYDNLGTFFKTGVGTTNNLALSGGNATTTYRFSLGHVNQTGVVPKSDFNRTTVKFAGETALSRKLKTAASVTYVRSGGRRIQQGSNTSGIMLGLLRTPPTFDNSNGFDDPEDQTSSYLLADGSQRNFRGGGGYDNPYWTVNQSPFVDDVNRMYGFTSLSYDATKWLNVFYRVGTDFYTDRRNQHFAINSRTLPAGRVWEDQHFYRHFNSDLWVTANYNFTEDLGASLMVGNNVYDERYQRVYTQGDGFNFPDFYHISNAQNILSRETTNRKRTAAIFADAKLNYRDWLFLNLTGRNEWSSTLPTDNNSFFYPSASLGFVFTEVAGLSENMAFPYGKLRVSYAIVGNDAPVYSTQTYFESAAISDGWTNGVAFPFGGVAAFTQEGVLGNPNLKPEQTSTFEIGADLRFLKNRLGLDVTYYNSRTVDQILAVAIAASSGYRFAVLNAGEVSNKGVELVLNATPVKTKDFRWDIQVNWQTNRNMVEELAEGLENVFIGGFSGTAIRNVAGQPYGVIYGGRYLRDDAGNLVIEDDSSATYFGYPIADPETGVIGDPNPDWLGSLRNTLTWKGLSFSFLLDFRQGGDIWNGTQGALTFFGMSKLTENRGDMTTFTGVKGTLDGDGNLISNGEANDVQVALDEDWYTDNGGGFGSVDEHFVQEASWTRLREVNLSYSLPSNVLSKTPFSSISVGLTGRNLLLITDYQGIDPETNLMGANNAQGLDYFNMPNTRSYIGNIRLTF